jgi:plastocyanin
MKTEFIALLFLLTSLSSASAELTVQSDVIVTVDSTNLRFSPSEVTVQEGQAVRFVWSGQALPHNAVADDGLFDSGEPERDVDYRFVFEIGTAGEHRFVCEPHESAGMIGNIIVEAAPAVVVEEESEPETVETPAVSLVASLSLLALVAVMRRPSEE